MKIKTIVASFSEDGHETDISLDPRDPGAVVVLAHDSESTVRTPWTPGEAEEFGLALLEAADKVRGEGMSVTEAVAKITAARDKVRRAKADN